MPKRNEKRDAAKAEYIVRKSRGEKVNLRELAEQMEVAYQLLRNWKTKDQWDRTLPKRQRGGQPGNTNSAGHRNAAGSHEGAPKGNKNAEKDGAYSTIFFDMLNDTEKALAALTPTKSREILEHEMKILKVREHRILGKITEYEEADKESLYLDTVTDMRVPGGTGRKDGGEQQMGMYNKDSAFARAMKLQEALYKVQGRIATVANSLRALEEMDRKMDLEGKRLDILRMRATGQVEVEVQEEDEAEEPEGDGRIE